MEAAAHCRHARNGGPLASGWLSNVLEAHFPSTETAGGSRLPKQVRELIFRMGSSRESDLGSAPHSRRAAHARFRPLGTDDLPLDETSAEGPGTDETLARVSAESSRSYCGDGFLHRTNHQVRSLYCFFVIGHDRRRILHFNVTKHPTSLWVVQQFREAFPLVHLLAFLCFDRDGKYGVLGSGCSSGPGNEPLRTSFRSPWQNGVAERWIESCRRDLLDHVIVVNEAASEAAAVRICQLLPRRSNASRTGEGNAYRESQLCQYRSRRFA